MKLLDWKFKKHKSCEVITLDISYELPNEVIMDATLLIIHYNYRRTFLKMGKHRRADLIDTLLSSVACFPDLKEGCVTYSEDDSVLEYFVKWNKEKGEE